VKRVELAKDDEYLTMTPAQLNFMSQQHEEVKREWQAITFHRGLNVLYDLSHGFMVGEVDMKSNKIANIIVSVNFLM
jgi:hypothetical protein